MARGCYRGNRAGSAAVAAMIATHRGLGTWTKMVCYITISQFAASKLLEGGLPADKMVVKPNFVTPDPGGGTGWGDPADLAPQVEWMLDRPQERGKMRAAARAEFEVKYTEEENYRKLMAIYQQVLASRQDRDLCAIAIVSNK